MGCDKTHHVGADRVREVRLQTLMTEFDRLKMKETDKIDDFVGKLSEISSKTTQGESMNEAKLVKKFLQGIPRKKFIHIVASLEQLLDLNTANFEDVVGRLKAYEERIAAEEEEETQDDQSKLMYSNSEPQHRDRGYRGRGRGGRYYNRGRKIIILGK